MTFHVASNVAWIMYYEHIPVPQWFLNKYGGIERTHRSGMDPAIRKCYENDGTVFRTSAIQRAVLNWEGTDSITSINVIIAHASCTPQ